MIELEDRILLNNGVSIVSDEYASQKIIDNGFLPDNVKVVKSKDSDLYDLLYRSDISCDIDSIDETVVPEIYCDMEHSELVEYILAKRNDNTPDDEHDKRVTMELEFFIETNNMNLLCSIKKLIDKFKNDGIVWGVGRGSSCASYVLFLLEVHSINPITYDINFSEFSKV